MANDELMRLAERVDALIGDYAFEVPGADAIAADLRALAQRAPQNGAVPAGWREEILVNIKRSCVRGRNSAGIPDTPMASSYVATCDHIENLADQALAAVSCPTPAADAGGVTDEMVERAATAFITHNPGREAVLHSAMRDALTAALAPEVRHGE